MKHFERFRSVGMLLFLAALILTPAFAVDVTYSTTGTFSNCTGDLSCSGTNSLTGANGGLQIVFNGIPADFPNITVPPLSTTSFGAFQQTGPSGANSDTGTAHFTLTITQTLPAPGGTETITDELSGTLTRTNDHGTAVVFASGNGTAGPAVLTNDPVTTSLPAFKFTFVGPDGNVTYWVDQSTAIVPPSVGGNSSIQGAMDSPVPEPTFYALIGAGFAGLLAMAIGRRRQQAA